jgi:hypothetical protein
MVDGYDYDYMEVDYDNDILYIVRGSKEYEYQYSTNKSLFEGGKANEVPFREFGKSDEHTDEYDEDYEDTHEWSIYGGKKHGFSQDRWGW